MPRYQITAKDIQGNQIKKVIEAQNEEDAANLALEQDLYIEKINRLIHEKIRMRPAEKMNFIRLLAVTVRSGLPLLRGLRTILRENNTSQINILVLSLIAELEGGLSLSQAMENRDGLFSELEVSMVKAGEASGRLAVTLQQLYDFQASSYKFRKKLRSALSYPFIVFSFSIFVLIFFMAFIVPKFKDTYSSISKKLPEMTVFLLGISSWMNDNIIEIFIGLALCIIASVYFIKASKFKIYGERLLMKVPVFGKLFYWGLVVRFCTTLSTLLENQVNFLTSLTIARSSTDSEWINDRMINLIKYVKEGNSLSDFFNKEEIFPELAVQMVQMGEETGKLDIMLKNTAEYYQENMEYSMQNLESILQPFVIIFLGIFIAILVLVLFLPLFDLPATLNISD